MADPPVNARAGANALRNRHDRIRRSPRVRGDWTNSLGGIWQFLQDLAGVKDDDEQTRWQPARWFVREASIKAARLEAMRRDGRLTVGVDCEKRVGRWFYSPEAIVRQLSNKDDRDALIDAIARERSLSTPLRSRWIALETR